VGDRYFIINPKHLVLGLIFVQVNKRNVREDLVDEETLLRTGLVEAHEPAVCLDPHAERGCWLLEL